MTSLSGIFQNFSPVKTLLLGDFMVDQHTTGKVKRISPEAPVPILQVEKEESLPGGAGNVALNLLSLGSEVFVVGRIGEDAAGVFLKKALEKEGIFVESLLVQKGYHTPVKNRFIAESQQILRVDHERIELIDPVLEEQIFQKLDCLLQEVQIVALSDYGKGFLSERLISQVILKAKQKQIPVIVDPKGTDFSKYKGAWLVKPNLSEAYAAAKLSLKEPLKSVAEVLLKDTFAEKLLITRAEAGMTLFDREMNRSDFSVRSKEVKDVTGAGDTVLATLCVALANQIDLAHAIQLANFSAGIAIEMVGCARVQLSDLAGRLLESDATNKIFDEHHLYALRQHLRGKKVAVLYLTSFGADFQTFRWIRKIFKEERELIVYVKEPQNEFLQFLSSLKEVDFIVVQRESLKNLCEIMQPEIVLEANQETIFSID